MMMPANFSAIAETEMTYVVGGGLEAYLAPVMTAANWQTYNTNLITIIGNAFMGNYISNTLGNIFGGEYYVGKVAGSFADDLSGAFQGGFDAAQQKTKDAQWYHVVARNANGALNAGLNIVGNLAAVYTLAHGNAKSLHTSSVLKAF